MNMLEMTKQIMSTMKIKIDKMKEIKNPTPENDLELFNLLQTTCLLQHLSSACTYHEQSAKLLSKFSTIACGVITDAIDKAEARTGGFSKEEVLKMLAPPANAIDLMQIIPIEAQYHADRITVGKLLNIINNFEDSKSNFYNKDKETEIDFGIDISEIIKSMKS